jgi:hypothetical protein
MYDHPPTFIETSVGYINLALVRHIEVQSETVLFWFAGTRGGMEAVVIPLQEGERILSQIRMNILIS